MIWIIGRDGMLGKELAETLASAGTAFIGSDREVSVLDPRALERFSSGRRILWIVNCAAYTAVDKAEDEPEACEALNVAGPENLARLAKAMGARLLHISTDYVFDGSGDRPYREEDALSPLGAYGRSKAAGESCARAIAPETIVLRTAWLYGRHGSNFVATMLRLMRERETVRVVADQRGSPTWARDLANAILTIMTSDDSPPGVYHFTDAGEVSWFEFAAEIERSGREMGLLLRSCSVEPIPTSEYPTKARRPAYSVLSKEKITRVFGITPPDWRESLRNHLAETAHD